MSRRYGRKQRRAARQQIATLTADVVSLHGSFISEARSRRSAQDKVEFLLQSIKLWDDEIRSLLGPYTSFAIDDTTFRVDHPDQIRQMPVMPALPVFPLSSMMPGLLMEETISYHIENMLGFVTGLEDGDRAMLQKLMTVRVKIGSDSADQSAYWALSYKLWHDMKRDGPNSPGLNRFIYRIAGDLVRLLAQPPKKKVA